LQMSETHILIRLLRMYFPRNWEFGSALSKFRNFFLGGRFWTPPNTPSQYATVSNQRHHVQWTPRDNYHGFPRVLNPEDEALPFQIPAQSFDMSLTLMPDKVHSVVSGLPNGRTGFDSPAQPDRLQNTWHVQ
jgi:hypothetical protein